MTGDALVAIWTPEPVLARSRSRQWHSFASGRGFSPSLRSTIGILLGVFHDLFERSRRRSRVSPGVFAVPLRAIGGFGGVLAVGRGHWHQMHLTHSGILDPTLPKEDRTG